jgi:hypothetical protein
MSHAPHSEPAADLRHAPADVARNLFWDDARAGLKLASVGLILLLVAELGGRFRLHEFLGGAITVVGSLLCILGLGICTVIPKEAGVRNLTLTAAGCAALGLLALLVGLFGLAEFPLLDALPVVLGAVALVLFALMLRSVTSYVGHRILAAAARQNVIMTGGFAALLVVVALTGQTESAPVRVLEDLLAIGVVGAIVYLAWGTADAIQRARQGLPVETPRVMPSAEQLAAEELRRSKENLVYTPSAPPHFSEAEVRFFHADDSKAAGAIVVLMAGIFAVGIVLYTIVAWSCAS